MIRLEEVTTECFDNVSFEIEKGSVCRLTADSDYGKRELLDTMLGLKMPVRGRVMLFGCDIYTVSESEAIAILKETGVIWEDGGLISNLKVWENIVLPVWYHTGKEPDAIEEEIVQLFGEIGIAMSGLSDYLRRLSGPLPDHEKRVIGFIRSVLMKPSLMIYDSLFEGLDKKKAVRLSELTTSFHHGKEGRTSLYVATDEFSLKDISADMAIRQEGRRFKVWR